jgi:chromate transporter
MNPSGATQAEESNEKVSLAKLAIIFLKLGTLGFGGPAAHIAMMEEEFVRKRHWIRPAKFLDLLAAASLIPGPSSTEVALFIGYAQRGWPGLLLGGCCFIFPAGVLVTWIAAIYVRFGSAPQAAGVLYGIKAAVMAIILHALWSLSRTALKTRVLAGIGAGAFLLNACGVAPLPVLTVAGLAAALWMFCKKQDPVGVAAIPVLGQLGLIVGTARGTVPVSLLRLFLTFLKTGSVVFGSGYVLLAFLRTDFVEHLHWLTEKQLMDAIAVGQFTPGPVFTTATFIGYLVGGLPGALLATIGIFLPGFVLVLATGPILPRLRQSALASAILDGVVAGSLALMAIVAWQLGRAAIVDWITLMILLASSILVFWLRINSVWMIAGAGLLGWLLR